MEPQANVGTSITGMRLWDDYVTAITHTRGLQKNNVGVGSGRMYVSAVLEDTLKGGAKKPELAKCGPLLDPQVLCGNLS